MKIKRTKFPLLLFTSAVCLLIIFFSCERNKTPLSLTQGRLTLSSGGQKYGRGKPGSHQAVWDGLDDLGNQVASGVYFYRIQAGEFVAVNKMMLLR